MASPTVLITGVVDEAPSAEDALGNDAPAVPGVGAGAGSFVADMARVSLVRGIMGAGEGNNYANAVLRLVICR